MATYQQLVAQGMSPNQAALQAQLGASGGTPTAVNRPPTYQPAVAPPPVGRMGNQPTGPQPGSPAPSMGNQPLAPPGPGFSSPSNTATPPAGTGPAPGVGVGKYTPEGVDMGKFGDLSHDTPKYQIMRTLSNFDPTQGITDEAWQALQSLGILGEGAERLSGDKIRIGTGADPRFEGTTTFDLVRGLNGPGGGQAWQFGVEDAPGAGGGGGGAAQTAGGGGMMGASAMAQPGLNALLSGDPLARIQDAIGKINGNGQVNLQALLSQLQGV